MTPQRYSPEPTPLPRRSKTFRGAARLQATIRALRAENASLRQQANEHDWLRTLIDQLPDYLYVKGLDSRVLLANRAFAADCRVSGPAEMVGKTDFDFHAPMLARRFFEEEQALLRSGEPMIDQEECVHDTAGRKNWFASSKVPMRNARNEITGLIGVARSITERKQAEELRAGEAHLLEMIAMSAPLHDVLDRLVRLIEAQLSKISCSILLLDDQGLHLKRGAAPSLPEEYNRLIDGLPIGPKVGSCGTAAFRREPVIVTDILTDPLWEDYRAAAISFGLRSCWSTPVLSHQRTVLGLFAMYSSEVRTPTPAELRLVTMATRIAGIAIERKQAEDRIRYMAHHDTLTGLPNRTVLEQELERAMRRAERCGRTVTVAFLDLDNFKLVNDTLGHTTGDELLKIVARRMAQCLRPDDTVVRLGGDEFVIILSADEAEQPGRALATVQEVRRAIAAPLEIDGRAFQISSSVGLAVFPHDGREAKVLLANADTAMYRAKSLGRDNFQFYTAEMNSKISKSLLLQEELRNAIANRQLLLHYQPQIDLASGRIQGVEALIRWLHPGFGMVSPCEFIPIAEESGLIVPIGDWVLQTACRQNAAWQKSGLPPVRMCVNVSTRQFRDKSLIGSVRAALEKSGLDASHLELELTESLIMEDVPGAIATMRELQQLGVQLAIDDFGTGYSSLSALKHFPVARLKIDRTFVRDIPRDDDDKAIVSAIISLGQKLNLRVIAEGVETDDQVAFLRANHCEEMQGFLFSRPVPAADIEVLLKNKAAFAPSCRS
jgi:diguanylate cyclase (GGDEF)-like protein/PAS domain S-box-containing protein